MRRPAIFLCLGLALIVVSADATELSGSSVTLPYFYERSRADDKEFFAPLYEYLTVNLVNIEDTGLSAHGSGWGRLDLGATPDPDSSDAGEGDLTYGYLDWRGPEDYVRVLAGRHLVSQGVTYENIDALELHLDSPWGPGLSGFGGWPVHSSLGDRDGDAAFGGRLYYHYRHFVELGASYGQFREADRTDRENIGADLCASPVRYLDLAGHAYWDMIYGRIYDAAGVLTVYPVRDLKLLFHYDRRMPSAAFGKTSIFSVFSWDQVQEFGGQASYLVAGKVYLDGEYAHLIHDDGADADRVGGGFTYYYGGFLGDGVGASYRRLAAGLEDSYHQGRVFWFHRFPKGISASADLIADFLDRERFGAGQSYTAVGSLGWTITRGLEVLGSLDYGRTPLFDDELRGLLRLAYNAGVTF